MQSAILLALTLAVVLVGAVASYTRRFDVVGVVVLALVGVGWFTACMRTVDSIRSCWRRRRPFRRPRRREPTWPLRAHFAMTAVITFLVVFTVGTAGTVPA